MSAAGIQHPILEARRIQPSELRKRISACVRKMLALTMNKAPVNDQTLRITAWANVARAGSYNAVHNHAPALYSGVYYAGVGDPAPEAAAMASSNSSTRGLAHTADRCQPMHLTAP